MVDAYRQPYIPFYLATREFFELVRDRLRPGGAVIVNAGHPEGQDDLEKVLAATMARGVPDRAARSERGHEHAAGRHDRRRVGGAAAPGGAAACRPTCGRSRVAAAGGSRPASRAAPSTPTTRRRSSG